jgi:hypothetical protein
MKIEFGLEMMYQLNDQINEMYLHEGQWINYLTKEKNLCEEKNK